MAKSLNFRNFAQPTLPITMNDAEGTIITCVAPTVELVERLEANQDEIIAILKRGDRETVGELWKLTADLISCNREHINVTVNDLKGKYQVNYEMLLLFFVSYIEFLEEIKSAKN